MEQRYCGANVNYSLTKLKYIKSYIQYNCFQPENALPESVPRLNNEQSPVSCAGFVLERAAVFVSGCGYGRSAVAVGTCQYEWRPPASYITCCCYHHRLESSRTSHTRLLSHYEIPLSGKLGAGVLPQEEAVLKQGFSICGLRPLVDLKITVKFSVLILRIWENFVRWRIFARTKVFPAKNSSQLNLFCIRYNGQPLIYFYNYLFI